MPELLERGHLYIAQPPLYRAKRGDSLRYLKGDREMEAYLIDSGLRDAVLTHHDEGQMAGEDLRHLVERAVRARHFMEPLIRKVGNADVVEQAAIAGALSGDVLADDARAAQTAEYIATRLDALAKDHEKGWQGGSLPDGGLSFTRILRGVTEQRVIDGPLIRASEARRLDEMASELQEGYAHHGELTSKEKTYRITGPISLVTAIFELGRKGVSVARYKGLGEMNPEQLWETTLDPNVRALLQVRVAHADEAEDVFSTLMGDVVEPRRDFIQQHALEVANLDV
jgi:DNA gyrase subunit B